MQQLIRLLLDNPLIALVLVSWLLGSLGGVFKAAKKAKKEQEQRSQQGPAPAPPRRRTPEEVAAEMRRILGVDPVEPVPKPKPMPKPKPVKPATKVAKSVPKPVLPSDAERAPRAAIGKPMARMEAPHLQSSLGRSIEKRHTPATGQVGSHEVGNQALRNVALQGLGGRVARLHHRTRAGGNLVDLRDLARAIVLREVIDRPLSLRPDW
jgi:outer membrane biosynthesis protein TonB